MYLPHFPSTQSPLLTASPCQYSREELERLNFEWGSSMCPLAPLTARRLEEVERRKGRVEQEDVDDRETHVFEELEENRHDVLWDSVSVSEQSTQTPRAWWEGEGIRSVTPCSNENEIYERRTSHASNVLSRLCIDSFPDGLSARQRAALSVSQTHDLARQCQEVDPDASLCATLDVLSRSIYRSPQPSHLRGVESTTKVYASPRNRPGGLISTPSLHAADGEVLTIMRHAKGKIDDPSEEANSKVEGDMICREESCSASSSSSSSSLTSRSTFPSSVTDLSRDAESLICRQNVLHHDQGRQLVLQRLKCDPNLVEENTLDRLMQSFLERPLFPNFDVESSPDHSPRQNIDDGILYVPPTPGNGDERVGSVASSFSFGKRPNDLYEYTDSSLFAGLPKTDSTSLSHEHKFEDFVPYSPLSHPFDRAVSDVNASVTNARLSGNVLTHLSRLSCRSVDESMKKNSSPAHYALDLQRRILCLESSEGDIQKKDERIVRRETVVPQSNSSNVSTLISPSSKYENVEVDTLIVPVEDHDRTQPPQAEEKFRVSFPSPHSHEEFDRRLTSWNANYAMQNAFFLKTNHTMSSSASR